VRSADGFDELSNNAANTGSGWAPERLDLQELKTRRV
jgi:hypothetical protein